MVLISMEELIKNAGNRYLAVVLAAKEARRLNALPPEKRENPQSKTTILALERLAKGRIKYKREKERQ